ncbi:hypothetical protein FF1_034844 [Malus domestica]
MFWDVFVLGHDCGHGSFSDSRILNSVVGGRVIVLEEAVDELREAGGVVIAEVLASAAKQGSSGIRRRDQPWEVDERGTGEK